MLGSRSSSWLLTAILALAACGDSTGPGGAGSLGKLASITAGPDHSCAVTTQGKGYCWGLAALGRLGNGSTVAAEFSPAPVSGGLTFARISAGSDFTCGLTALGAAHCWGDDAFETKLGRGSQVSLDSLPGPVVGGLSFREIASGFDHTCAITAAGAAYCWGSNGLGQLGNGSASAPVASPVAVSGGKVFMAITAGGGFTCGLVVGGAAYCWGVNDARLGSGGTGQIVKPVPTQVASGLLFGSIDAGPGHTCAVTTGGQAYCWGFNDQGQLGNGQFGAEASVPVAVQSTLAFFRISAGQIHTCAVASGGAAYCWGFGGSGALGNGDQSLSWSIPVAVEGGHKYSAIAAAVGHTCAVATDGSGYCWGDDGYGELGGGSFGSRSRPRRVAGF